MPEAEKALHTTNKNHSGEILIFAHDHEGHQLQMFGCLTDSMFEVLKKDYTIEMEDNSYTDIKKTDWYRESQDRLHHGGLIKILRKNRKMSQRDLGKLLNVTGKYISDLEQGRRPVSVTMAKKLSGVFDRKPERFLHLEK